MTDTLTHHELTAEWVNDNQGQAIMLTQPADNYDEPATVLIHPWQLRAVCEQFGIIASDQQAAKTITTLTRRLFLLRDRIEHLDELLSSVKCYPPGLKSYSTEEIYSVALLDLANEFCAELDSAGAALEDEVPQ